MYHGGKRDELGQRDVVVPDGDPGGLARPLLLDTHGMPTLCLAKVGICGDARLSDVHEPVHEAVEALAAGFLEGPRQPRPRGAQLL